MLRPREISESMALFAARTPTLPPATHTNSYALGSAEVLLVEPATPYEEEQRAWMDWARSLAGRGRTPVAILATHHHADHVGGLDVLSRGLGLPVWAHAETAVRIGAPVARRLSDGEAIDLRGPVAQRWQVLHTPGHAPGHLCLWNADERAVIVGDMVAGVGTILIDPRDGDMAVYLEQLDRLARLDARQAFPAHGEPIDEPSARFRHTIAHRRMRESKVLAAVVKGGAAGATAEEILVNAYDDVAPGVLPIALLSVRAHLKKLSAEGHVRAGDGTRYIACS